MIKNATLGPFTGAAGQNYAFRRLHMSKVGGYRKNSFIFSEAVSGMNKVWQLKYSP